MILDDTADVRSAATADADLAPLAADFIAPPWLANAHLQSILPSLRLRRPLIARRARRLLACSRTEILDCGDGVRLLGHYSGQDTSTPSKAAGPKARARDCAAGSEEPAQDLVVLLHGWEGSADSSYVLSLGSHLFELGCEIYRLNLRDHGDSHHLNEDIFHSCRLDEVVGAVRYIQRAHPDRRLTIAGFSLGGNFALRVAARAPAAGIRLERCIAICPVLRPHSTMEVLEHGPFVYRRYFISKWKRSLQIKQRCFPQRYDFRHILEQNSIETMTRILVERYSKFADLDAYLNGYAIVGDVLADLRIPSHLLIALDDPIIPARDVRDLARNPLLQIKNCTHGGHCGFMDGFNRASWADRHVGRIIRGNLA